LLCVCLDLATYGLVVSPTDQPQKNPLKYANPLIFLSKKKNRNPSHFIFSEDISFIGYTLSVWSQLIYFVATPIIGNAPFLAVFLDWIKLTLTGSIFAAAC
jgi:hypothetical protein